MEERTEKPSCQVENPFIPTTCFWMNGWRRSAVYTNDVHGSRKKVKLVLMKNKSVSSVSTLSTEWRRIVSISLDKREKDSSSSSSSSLFPGFERFRLKSEKNGFGLIWWFVTVNQTTTSTSRVTFSCHIFWLLPTEFRPRELIQYKNSLWFTILWF